MADPAPLWETIVTLVLIVLMFIVLAVDKFPPDFVMYFTVVILTACGIISMKDALSVRIPGLWVLVVNRC